MKLGAAPVAHEGFQVQVHGDVLGRCDGDADGAGEVVDTGVHHVAFTRKNALRKNQHCSDDGVIRGGNAQLGMGGLRLAPQADGEGGVELGVGRDHAPMPISLVQWTAQLSLGVFLIVAELQQQVLFFLTQLGSGPALR